jgi:hypothetical protein
VATNVPSCDWVRPDLIGNERLLTTLLVLRLRGQGRGRTSQVLGRSSPCDCEFVARVSRAVLVWVILTVLVLWSAVALLVVSLCAAAARGDRHLSAEPDRGAVLQLPLAG